MEISKDDPYHWSNLVANMNSNEKPNRKERRKESKNLIPIKNTSIPNNDLQNMIFMNLLSSMLPDNNTVLDTEESIKVKIANLVLHKLGISDHKFTEYIEEGKGLEITSMTQDLLNKVLLTPKSNEFLIVVEYEGGSYGYIEYTGSYSDAKKHSIRCLAKEHGQDMFAEQDVIISSHPIYKVGLGKITCTVIPHIKGIWN